MGKPSAWLMITLTGNRQYGGNLGYSDEVENVYRYDADVPNHRQVAVGDLAILRDRKKALGFARVVRVVTTNIFKKRRRCPTCHTAKIKERRTTQPVFRCDFSHEFDVPLEEEVPCTGFEAFFDGTFVPITTLLPISSLRAACKNWNDQLAMQRLDVEKALPLLYQVAPHVDDFIDSFTDRYLEPEDAAIDGHEEYVLGNVDGRTAVLRQIRARRGQRSFRENLIERYGPLCMISECPLLDVVEAAHIQPYRCLADNHPENGLLLRTDLHTLFDLDLLGIDPATLMVAVNPTVASAGYGWLEGSRVRCGTSRPSDAALVRRWSLFRQRLGIQQE